MYSLSFAQDIPEDSLYFGQTPPGKSPEIFAPGVISLSDRYETNITFSPDGKEVYYYTSAGILFKEYKDNSWSVEQEASFSGVSPYISAVTPNFSVDGNKIYFTKWSDDISTSDFWVTKRTDNGWSPPELLPVPYNSDFRELGTISETLDGILYFSSERSGSWNIYQTLSLDSLPTEASRLELLGNAGNPCIASDGSYLIFNSNRSDSYGEDDLYISFKNDTDEWGTPINMNSSGVNINVKDHWSINPSLSPDGKYLFYNFHNATGLLPHIYWVSTEIIDDLKQIDLGTSIKENNPSCLKIYPNPVHNILHIENSDLSIKETNYQLINLSGKIVKQGKEESETIDISGLSKGVYMLQIKTSKENFSKKIVIE